MVFKNCYKKQFNKNKFILSLLFLILALVSSIFVRNIDVNADSETSDDIEQEFSQIVSDIVSDIDLIDLDLILKDLESFEMFDGSIRNKINQILKGEYFSNFPNVISGILSLFFVDIKDFLPFIFTILAIGVLANLFNEFGSDNCSTNDVVHFVCFGVMIIVVLVVFKDVLNTTSTTLNLILKQMQIIFPILIGLLTTIGSFSTISIYNPLVAILTAIVSIVFDKFLYPIFILIFVLSIIGHLTETVKLDKLQGFVASCFKWIVGIVFTLFTGFLSIQGISAGRFDSISIKATKFAIKSYIPIIGSYLSEGMDFLVLGSVLVKNTIGLVGVLILFLSIVSPIISMLVLKLGLQLCSAILEMCGSKRMSAFVSSCSKILIYPIVLILGVAFMYVITIALIMCTANIF